MKYHTQTIWCTTEHPGRTQAKPKGKVRENNVRVAFQLTIRRPRKIIKAFHLCPQLLLPVRFPMIDNCYFLTVASIPDDTVTSL